MHPEIEEILINLHHQDIFIPNIAILDNAERLLNYFDDINVERISKFEPTAAETLYIIWNVEDLEFHIECLQNGNILYTFRKGGYGKASGSLTIDQFIPQLERYLLLSIW